MLIVMKFGGTSVGSAERIAQAAQLAADSAALGHQVVVVTSAMSKVTDALIAAARQASAGHWDPAIRQQLFERHKAVADAIIGSDPARHATVLDALRQRLDRFEKLCYGLSMVHELTPAVARRHLRYRRNADGAAALSGDRRARPHVAAFDATELIVTTDQFGGAEPLLEQTRTKTQARLQPASPTARSPSSPASLPRRLTVW
jgi:aspartate kinase